MCGIIEKLMEGQSRNDRIECADRLITLGKLSSEQISKAMHLPLSTIEELAEAQKKHL